MIVRFSHPVFQEGTCRLTPGWQYLVLSIADDMYRILDDSGDPILFSKDLFEITDPAEPSDWESRYCDGSRYAQSSFLDQYVWEDYHEGVPEAVQQVRKYLDQLGPCSWPAEGTAG
jgi:hypothetical protein